MGRSIGVAALALMTLTAAAPAPEAGKPPIYRIVRPRTVIYSLLIVAVGALMLYTLMTRSLLDVNVLHDRNPVLVRLSDGSIRNGYTVRLLNKRGLARVVAVDISGLKGATLHVVGADRQAMEKTLHSLKKESGITIEPGEMSRCSVSSRRLASRFMRALSMKPARVRGSRARKMFSATVRFPTVESS